MEVENPFVVSFGAEFADQRNFSQFILKRAALHPTEIALVDVESPAQRWRYGDMRECVDRCKQRLQEIGVGAGYRLALITSTTCRVIFIHLACAELNAIAVCINGWANVDEIWHQLDEVECSHAVTETQFTGKVEELRRKALMRGLNRCRVVRTLDEVLGNLKLTRQKRESKTL